MNIIGFFGSVLLAICSIPEMIRTIQDGRCHLGWGFLGMWYGGELLSLYYGIELKEIPLILNYTINVIALSIMTYYKIWGKKKLK